MPSNHEVALIIPTLNAERDNWKDILAQIANQTFQPETKLILDSASTDQTVDIAKGFGFVHHSVQPGTFDHAGTRKWGVSLVPDTVKFIIFMTHDALLASPISLQTLVKSFEDEQVCVAYGRQLPRDNASPTEAFARHFNYPEKPETRSIQDLDKYGMKIAFCSDSFAAYRVNSIREFDAFPDRSIVGEDYITAARLLLKGKSIRYEAAATVKHSHNYSISEEFKRYFDIGVFHQEHQKLLSALGNSEKKGAGFVINELSFLLKNHPTFIPLALIKTLSKYFGYKLGKHHNTLPRSIRKRLSMHHFYFK